MTVVVIGGTGSLGTALIEKLSATHPTGVVCFSRDEVKQAAMRGRFQNVKFVLGDIRDRRSLPRAMASASAVFHVAALKQVDTLQGNPEEAIKTNVIGTMNVAEAAMEAGVPFVVFSSTDKAVLPVNVYGNCKAISEQYLFGLNDKQKNTHFGVYRWGNVAASRGSAIPYFVEAIKAGQPVNITHVDMSRFWIRISDAVDYMLSSYQLSDPSQPMIPKMKAAKVVRVVETIARILGKPLRMNVTEIRPGEKIAECLYSSHTHCVRSDTSPQYTDAELETLLSEVINAI